MAKKSKIAAQRRREAIVARYAGRRAALKETIRRGTPEEAEAAMKALQKMPRDASPVRLRNRDVADGRTARPPAPLRPLARALPPDGACRRAARRGEGELVNSNL